MNTILLNHRAGSYSVQDENSGQMVGSLSQENATRQSRWIASRRAARGRAESLEQLAGEGKRSRRTVFFS